MILIVSTSCGSSLPPYQAVVEGIHKRGSSVLVYKQDLCLSGETVSWVSHDEHLKCILTIDGCDINFEDVKTVWIEHPILPKSLRRYEPQEHATFIYRQFLMLRQALWLVDKSKKWLNQPSKSAEAENKLYQLQVAKLVGLQIPRTIVTSNPKLVKNFYDDLGGNVITKIVVPSPINDHVIMTTALTTEHMKEIDSVRYCPAIFQEKVSKSYELRITVVGDRIFATKIHSQSDPATAVDWRAKPQLNDGGVKMEPTTLDKGIEEKVHVFMDTIGLQYGCIDMIVTPQGEHVFLEINPSGQWYFVQLGTGQEIGDAIADLLVRL